MSSDRSKYVLETGPGYEGVVRVNDGSVNICLNTINAADWPAETSVGFFDDAAGVRALPIADAPASADPIGTVTNVYRDRGSGHRISVPVPVVDALGVPDGEDIRLYDDGRPGLLLVNAAADPTLDGGEA